MHCFYAICIKVNNLVCCIGNSRLLHCRRIFPIPVHNLLKALRQVGAGKLCNCLLYTSGIFHPHAQWHHIKKENIGLIEVMGHFILPGRLESELSLLKKALIAHDVDKIPADSPAFKHAEWGREILARRNVTQENIDTILQQEVGSICCHVLQDAGVFKTTASGRAGFVKFLNTLGWSQN